MNLSELLAYAPKHPAGGAHDPLAFGAEIRAWLEVEDGAPPTGTLSGGTYTIVAFVADTDGEYLFAVPDTAVDASLRAVLDQPWGHVFAIEEIEVPGPAWIVVLAGVRSPGEYHWLGENLGIDHELFGAAHGVWRQYEIEAADLVGVRVSHLYRARLAH